jgi:hypothetical protein
MATTSKRQVLRSAVSRTRKKRSKAEVDKLGEGLLSSKKKVPVEQKDLARVQLLLEQQDLHWLDATVAQIKPERRSTNRNEVIRLGITLIKQKSPEELRELLGDWK